MRLGGVARRRATAASCGGRHLVKRLAQTGPGGHGTVTDDRAGRVGEGQLPEADPSFLSRVDPGVMRASIGWVAG